MKQENDLKSLVFQPKQTWWFVQDMKIRTVEYLCVFPFNNPENIGTYDIVIYKDSAEPVRMYRTTLVELIEKYKHVTCYEDACVELIEQARERYESIKMIYAP